MNQSSFISLSRAASGSPVPRAQCDRPGPTSGRRGPSWRTLVCALVCAACLVSTGGCEALQRKLTRKPKHPKARPSPIVQFRDYSQAMTTLDRYRKHYMLFDYWNAELLEALGGARLSVYELRNPKRIKRTSEEALQELELMRDLVVEEVAIQLEPLIAARSKVDRELQSGRISASSTEIVRRALEKQTRQIHREFFWRDVEDHLIQDASAP